VSFPPGSTAWLAALCSSRVLAAALLLHGSSPENALLFTALTYVANIAGSIVGGTMADRWGRTRTILLWSSVSLMLSFTIGWLMALPIALLVALACLYNFAGIADSSTHSTVLAESVPPHYLGVAWMTFGLGALLGPVVTWKLHRMRN
jgi:MFS family permease